MNFLLFLFICLLVGLGGGLLYIIYRPFRNKLINSGKLTSISSRRISKTIVTFLLLLSVSLTFFELYPPDSFYAGEFNDVTLRTLPVAAQIVKSSSSYPDFHGDYCSCSLIKISLQDYTRLKSELLNDNRFTKNGELIGSAEFSEVMNKFKSEEIQVSFQRIIAEQQDRYLYIAFLKDGFTIVVHKCIT